MGWCKGRHLGLKTRSPWVLLLLYLQLFLYFRYTLIYNVSLLVGRPQKYALNWLESDSIPIEQVFYGFSFFHRRTAWCQLLRRLWLPVARGAASQAMNMWRGLVRCLAACIVAWFGACFAVPRSDGNFFQTEPTEFPSRPQTRAVRAPGPLKKFFIPREDDRFLRPFWLCQALASYDSARRSPDAALVTKKIQNLIFS